MNCGTIDEVKSDIFKHNELFYNRKRLHSVAERKYHMKKHIGQIFLNVLKIWGATWIGVLVSVIPMYIMRGNGAGSYTEYLVDGLIGLGVTAIALFYYFIWEGRNNNRRHYTKKEMLLLSVLPTPIWTLFCCLFAKSAFVIMGNLALFCSAIFGYESTSQWSFITPLPIALGAGAIYSTSMFLGYLYGSTHQKY